MSESEDVNLPRATLQKIIKDTMPGDLRMSSELMEMLIKCSTEFVQTVSSEANEVCSRENKSTINPDHVLRALSDLGFTDFLGDVREAHEQFKQESQGHVKLGARKTGAEEAGLSQAQQIALQQKMFAEARARSMSLQPPPPEQQQQQQQQPPPPQQQQQLSPPQQQQTQQQQQQPSQEP